MKNLLLIVSLILGLAIWFYPQPSNSNGTGSPGGKTGSPNDIANNPISSCAGCHYAGVGTGATITTNIPSEGYIPGATYTITASIQQTGIAKFGFEVTAEDTSTGNKIGSFSITNSSQTKLTNGIHAVTHKAGGTSASVIGFKTWEFNWIAPGFAASTGSVKFWGSFMAANGDGQNTGDTYHAYETDVIEEGVISGITEQVINNFTISENKIKINNKLDHLIIYDISGKLLQTHNKLKTNQIINLNNLSKGIYMVHAIHEKRSISNTKKININ